MSSLVKFVQHQKTSGGDKLYWGRVEEDGLPFRGPMPPNWTDEEFAERTTKVADPGNGTFYTGDPVQNKQYMEIIDRIANGWYGLVFTERWREPGDKCHYVYIEWLAYHLQDGSAAPADSSRMLEINRGQSRQ